MNKNKKSKEASDYQEMLQEHYRDVDILRLKIAKRIWDNSGKPIPDFLEEQLRDYGLMEELK